MALNLLPDGAKAQIRQGFKHESDSYQNVLDGFRTPNACDIEKEPEYYLHRPYAIELGLVVIHLGF